MPDDDGASPLHTPNPRAAKLLAEGSALFAQRKPRQALLKYEAAMEAGPRASSAWVGAAGCYLMQGDWPRAGRSGLVCVDRGRSVATSELGQAGQVARRPGYH